MHQLAIILLLGLAFSDAPEERPARTGIVPNEVLVSTRGKIADVVRKIGKPIERIEDLDIWVVRLGRGVSVTDALVTLSQDRRVLFAEPHFIGRSAVNPNDPCFLAPTAAECNEHSQWAPQRIHANLAWDIWRPKKRVRLAINDTGVDNDHVDLTNKMLRDEGGIIGYNAFTSERSGADDPGNGSGHGTLVAGVAAAEINNARGMAGIAAWSPVTVYPWVKIMPVKSAVPTKPVRA